MFKTLGNIFVVVLMLFAFIGQAMSAAVMPCDMSDNIHQDHMQMSKSINGAMKSMSSEMDHSMVMDDCCNEDCSCPENACASAVLLFTQQKVHHTRITFEKINSVSFTVISYHQKSLYRPPILA